MAALAVDRRREEDEEELFRLYRDVFGHEMTEASRRRWGPAAGPPVGAGPPGLIPGAGEGGGGGGGRPATGWGPECDRRGARAGFPSARCGRRAAGSRGGRWGRGPHRRYARWEARRG